MNKLGKVAVALAMVFSIGAAWAETVAAYVQDGLVACWDGVENDGRSGLHVASLTEWKDTVDNRPFALTGVTVEKNRMVFSGDGATSYGILSLADTQATFEQCKNGTIEVVACPDGDCASTAIAVMGSSSSGIAIGNSGGNLIFSCSYSASFPVTYFVWQGTTNTISAAYASTNAYVNGKIGRPGTSSYFGDATTQANIGRRSNGKDGLKGSIYCIRLYNRALTAEEVAANRAVDVERFEKGNSRSDGDGSLLVTTRGIQYAENGLPAYGLTKGHVQGERITESAPRSVRISGARHAVCSGWTLERLIDDDWRAWQSGFGATCAFDYPEEPVRLTWRWSARPWVRDLPDAYQQVEYIESTGKQWINMQVKATTNLAAQVDLSFVAVPGDTSVLGARTKNDRIYLFHVYSGFCYGYGSYYSLNVSPVKDKRYRVETVLRDGLQELAAYDALSSSLVVKRTDAQSNKASYDIQLDLSLFGLNNSGNVGGLVSAKCYSVAIWSVDGEGTRTLLRDFVPCYQKSDEAVAGLYDFVSGEFFGDAAKSGVPFNVGAKVVRKGLSILVR